RRRRRLRYPCPHGGRPCSPAPDQPERPWADVPRAERSAERPPEKSAERSAERSEGTKEASTFGTKPRNLLRRSPRRPKPQAGVARVDLRTKRLVQRVLPGELVVMDHEDLDGVSAEALIDAEVGGVVNAARSISGRYPNLGPIRLLEAGIPLIDTVGPLLLRKVREGDELRLDGDRVYAGDRLVGVGIRQSAATIRESMGEAQLRLAERFESFARNTVDYMQRERDLLFGGSGLPPLDHELANRPVLVVVRGYNYKEDLAVLRPYIRDVRPVLLGVDGGADALIEAGYTPDLILGDMDSVSDEALSFAGPARRRWFGRGRPTELVLHAYRDGHAPGRERLEGLGVPFRVVEAAGTSEDAAFLLAHEKGAETIVAVGSHGNLREFLDKGREGMSSTFLVRLRVGE